MAGTDDATIPVAATEDVFEGMESPKFLVEIGGSGHLVFSDICLIGRDQGGLVALVHEAGLNLDEKLLRLGNDRPPVLDLQPVANVVGEAVPVVAVGEHVADPVGEVRRHGHALAAVGDDAPGPG